MDSPDAIDAALAEGLKAADAEFLAQFECQDTEPVVKPVRSGKRKRLAILREMYENETVPANVRVRAIEEYDRLAYTKLTKVKKEKPVETGLSDTDRALLG